jgi:protein-S-isoprenylcysteine O-methyltransferase Ste14
MPKNLLRWRVPLGFAFAAWYLFLARPASLDLYAITAALVIVGCALRSWAAGYLFKGKRVAVGGPYAYVRNPLYLGSFIIGIGCCIALWRRPLPVMAMILWAAFLLAYGVVYPAKAKAEEGELRASLNGPYESYASRVPAFLPWKGRVPDLGPQHFSRELYRRNREYQCILGSVGVLAFLFFKYFHGV